MKDVAKDCCCWLDEIADDAEGINNSPISELKLITVTKKNPRIHVVNLFLESSVKSDENVGDDRSFTEEEFSE